MSIFTQVLHRPCDLISYPLSCRLTDYPELQVLGRVVRLDAVLMMHRLAASQGSANDLSHNEDVLSYPPALILLRVRMSAYHDLTVPVPINVTGSSRSMRDSPHQRVPVTLQPKVVGVTEPACIRPQGALVYRARRWLFSGAANRCIQRIAMPLPSHVVSSAHPSRPRCVATALGRTRAGNDEGYAELTHLASRHSLTARRSRYTICPLRLRSSSLAHSASVACKSGVRRRMNRTAASAMTRVYATLTSPRYYDTISISRRRRGDII